MYLSTRKLMTEDISGTQSKLYSYHPHSNRYRFKNKTTSKRLNIFINDPKKRSYE